jgi:glycosyltransferase involved in cell wall biosynthesis
LIFERAVSVIIPTKLAGRRRHLIRRAIDSVLSQDGVRGVPLVIVNGWEQDPELAADISADRRLRVATLEHPDLPAALHSGRRMVDTAWFAELDDDDVLMPGALRTRVEALENDRQCDVVVTNGIRRGIDGDTLHFVENVSTIEADAVRAMFRYNWLLPGSWLCRTDSVGVELFEDIPRFRECTYLGLQFATRLRLKFLDCPTVIYHTDTQGSESKTVAYRLGVADATRRLLSLKLPPDVRASVRRMLGAACLDNADYCLLENDLSTAWCWYRESLRGPGAWRRSVFARRFVMPLLNRRL